MRLIIRGLICWLASLLVCSPVWAFSDAGLLNSPKAISYFLMRTTDTGNLASGLIYNQKIDDGSEWEVTYTGYRSVYLLTSNITKLDIQKKIKVIEVGPLCLKGLAGLGGIYSPAVGGGLIADFGGELSAKLLDDKAAIALPLYLSLFNDGLWLNVMPALTLKPVADSDYDFYGGGKVDGMIMTTNPSNTSSVSGKMNMYVALGIRRVWN